MPFSCRSQRQILLRAAALLQAFRPLAARAAKGGYRRQKRPAATGTAAAVPVRAAPAAHSSGAHRVGNGFAARQRRQQHRHGTKPALAANDGSAPIPAALPRAMRGWAAGETWFMLPAGDRSKKRPPVAGGSVFWPMPFRVSGPDQ